MNGGSSTQIALRLQRTKQASCNCPISYMIHCVCFPSPSKTPIRSSTPLLMGVVVPGFLRRNILQRRRFQRVIPAVMRVWVQPSRRGGRRFPISLLLLDAVWYDYQLSPQDTHPQMAPCREKTKVRHHLYIAICWRNEWLWFTVPKNAIKSFTVFLLWSDPFVSHRPLLQPTPHSFCCCWIRMSIEWPDA